MAILPLARSTVNWPAFLATAKQALGRSVTISLDKKSRPTDTLSAFIAALGEMKKVGTDPTSIIREPGGLLRFIHFAFMVADDYAVITELRESGCLDILSIPSVAPDIDLAVV